MKIVRKQPADWSGWPWLLSLVAGFMAACHCPPPQRHEIAKALQVQTGAKRSQPATPQTPPPTSDELVIYLDTSGSMQGYVSAAGQSVFSRALNTLREFSTTLARPVEVYLRTVEAQVGPPEPHAALVRAASEPAMYRGLHTNLAGALGVFNQPLHPVPATTGAPTPAQNAPPIPVPRFHVLVTDGVQSVTEVGANAFLVRKQMLALLEQGWSGTVIGLRSQFCCEFFSEKLNRKVPYNTAQRAVTEYRPFYLYLFSPDAAALDHFTQRLKDSLRQKSGAQEFVMHELPLSAAYATGSLKFEPTTGFQTAERARLTCQSLGNGTTNGPLFLSLQLKEESRAASVPFKLSFSVPWSPHGQDSGTPQELARLLRWELQPVYPQQEQPGERYPEIELQPEKLEVDTQGNFVMPATAKWPLAAGRACWRAYRLIGRLNQDAEPAWVRAWSTDDDSKPVAGSKTFDLTVALLGVWRNPVLAQQSVAEAYLRIGPR